ncbi:MAG: acyl-CoA dehydrogenase family protein [Candidatus Jordarchaeaceae archaeon]
MDIYSEIILMEELGYADPCVAAIMVIHTGTAAARIYKLAPEEIKQRYLPSIAKGEKILAFAMTEDAVPGSWLSYMKTTAKLVEGDKYIINGRKVFITNAGIADLFVVFARTNPKEKGHRGISIFLVERNFPGLVFEGEEPALGIRAASWGTILFDNCEVPKKNVILEAPNAFAAALDLFNVERLENSSVCNGIATRALDETINFLSQRKEPKNGESFLNTYQSLQFKISDMYALIRASRLNVWHTAYLMENVFPYIKQVSASKFFANEVVRKVCLEAVQLHGGYGYSTAFFVEKLLRDGIFGGIGWGTIEILKLRVIREIFREIGMSKK